ncbi:MAG: hypothetical protein KY464_01480 [Gemmatimonadetes bacterium]|nr:hypothetical protein [Gemmatimonadota bacterium]
MPGVAALLLDRLDAISVLIEEGKFLRASEALTGRRWLEGVNLTGVPEGPLRRAQQWIDAAHDTLHSPPIDVHLLQTILLEARRSLAT